eukprot:m.28148 g.28148  ORF g.28148 m.28148 type:complete len:77 (+) comp30580_c0_seq1:249-479(+)
MPTITQKVSITKRVHAFRDGAGDLTEEGESWKRPALLRNLSTVPAAAAAAAIPQLEMDCEQLIPSSGWPKKLARSC